jgi:hypothetical protein
MILTLRL